MYEICKSRDRGRQKHQMFCTHGCYRFLTLSACSARWHLLRAASSSQIILLQLLLTFLQLRNGKTCKYNKCRHNTYNPTCQSSTLPQNEGFVIYLIRSMSPRRARMVVRMLLMFLDSSDVNTSMYSRPIWPPITRSKRWSSATFVTILQSYLKHKKTKWIFLYLDQHDSVRSTVSNIMPHNSLMLTSDMSVIYYFNE